MKRSEQINEIAAAMAKAQGAIQPAVKDAKNEAFKRGDKVSKYADLAAVWQAIRQPFSDNGLAVFQQATLGEFGVQITTLMTHSSGQWIEFEPITVPVFKRDAHGVGSATTYGRRFALCAVAGVVADEDDDGNSASGKKDGNSESGKKDGNPIAKLEGLPPADPPKSEPGVTAARVAVNEAVREINACADADSLVAFLNTPDMKRLSVQVYHTWPDLWSGPEQSGLKGELEKAAVRFGAGAEVLAYLRNVEASKPLKKAA